jgi:Protein of unknown function (DUF3263)
MNEVELGAEAEVDFEAESNLSDVELLSDVEPLTDAPPAPVAGLTEREQRILAFERKWWRHAGSKEQAIRDVFDLSSTRYYQLLNGLLDKPAALAAEPMLVARLRRLRATRSRGR